MFFVLVVGLSVCSYFSLFIYQENQRIETNKTTDNTSYVLREELYYQLIMQSQCDSIKKKLSSSFLKQDSIVNTMIYFYPGGGCQSCIDEDLQSLLDYKKEFGKESVVILTIKSDNRDDKIKLKTLFQDFKVLQLQGKDIYIPMDYIGNKCRYFALIDSNKQIRNIYFPYMNGVGISRLLKIINHNYSQ